LVAGWMLARGVRQPARATPGISASLCIYIYIYEMSTKNLPGGKGRPARVADNTTAICEPIVYKMWEPRRLKTLWDFMACCRVTFTLYNYLPVSVYPVITQHMLLTTQQKTIYGFTVSRAACDNS
jgi:hypothetical protein